MKPLAFVIQRYGEEVNGGAETLCRHVARRLGRERPVEVVTTCARDYLTWENEFAAGPSEDNGVRVLRFSVARRRRVRAFGRLSQRLYRRPHTFADEAAWMLRQGPDAPGLHEHLRAHGAGYPLVVFFTYLYPTTYLGLPLVAERAVLAPMAHDEPPLHLGLFRALFHLPRGFIFNTDEERRFVHRTFDNAYIPWIVGGTGIDLPVPHPPGDEGDYLLYLGRVDVEKGCGELFDFYLRFAAAHDAAPRLLLAGEVKMKPPRHPKVRCLGFVDEGRKAELIAGALAVVVPSRHESLSLTALEAWAAAVPVVACGGSRVLEEHVARSGGGLLYGDYDSFSSALLRIERDRERARRLGGAGRDYVASNYRWERTIAVYARFLDETARRVGDAHAHRP